MQSPRHGFLAAAAVLLTLSACGPDAPETPDIFVIPVPDMSATPDMVDPPDMTTPLNMVEPPDMTTPAALFPFS